MAMTTWTMKARLTGLCPAVNHTQRVEICTPIIILMSLASQIIDAIHVDARCTPHSMQSGAAQGFTSQIRAMKWSLNSGFSYH